MAIQQTSTLSNSVIDVYKRKYQVSAIMNRLYDQLATDYTKFGADGKSMDELMASSTIYIPFLSAMAPATSAVSQTADVTPQILRDAKAGVTWTSRGAAIQWPKQLEIQAYTDYTAKAYERVGQNMQESVELLAQAAALQGSWVERKAARASLDAGTTSNNASDAIFREMQGTLLTLKIPGFVNNSGEANTWSAVMHPFPFHDISESGNVDTIGTYQDSGIHLRFELGQLGPFRLVVSPFAKVFGGAGADNATAVATTLATASNALATTIVTADDVSASIAAGKFWTIGTEETGNTFYPTNERFKVLSASTTTLTILGEAENGGLRFDHDAGVAIRNADSVYPILFGGPESLVKIYASDVGQYGKVVGPKISGILDQFNTIGWLYYGGYGRVSENRMVRYEVSTSYEA